MKTDVNVYPPDGLELNFYADMRGSIFLRYSLIEVAEIKRDQMFAIYGIGSVY